VDALDSVGHSVDRELDPHDFTYELHPEFPVEDIYNWDDVDPWLEWEPGEFVEMDNDEVTEELEHFRGPAFARRARAWMAMAAYPPIVLVRTKDGWTEVGDGRGRLSVATAAGHSHIPAVLALEKLT
jgi:hypothetical protein